MMPSLQFSRADRLSIRVSVCATALACLLVSVGCDYEKVQGKASLHEMDHDIPSHWPESLADLADKMRERIEILGGRDETAEQLDAESGEDSESGAESNDEKSVLEAESELLQILAWVPEVAADTDITEAAWVPLAEKSEGLHARLKLEGFSDPLGKQLLDFASELGNALKAEEKGDD